MNIVTKETNYKIRDFFKKNMKWILLIAIVALFFDIVEDIMQNEIHQFDTIVYHVVSLFINSNITTILLFITSLGSAIVVLSICVGSFLVFKNKNYAKYISLNLAVIFIINQVMKHIFQRQRPTEFRLINETGYSFPSGHSMVSMAFYGFIIYLVFKNVKNRYIKWGSIITLGILILLIGISRIYLGVHYASDVIGGFCFSIAYLIVYTNMISNKVIDKN